MWLILLQIANAENPTLIRQLSLRDGSPSCTKLAEEHTGLQEELQQLISADIRPSYVPMRAANCLLELYPTDLETYKLWMISPENRGLAFLVINKMESLPLEVSVPLAQAGLEGVHSKGVRIRLEGVGVPEIQQVLLSELQAGEEE